MSRNVKLAIFLTSGSLCAAGAGTLAAVAVTSNNAQTPSTTTTITLENGVTGPTGPAGPQGPPGETSCPTGSTFGELVINHPGGQVTIFTCIKNGA